MSSPEKQNQQEYIHCRNCSGQAGNSGKPVVWCQSEALRTRSASGVIANMSLSTTNYHLPRAFASDWAATRGICHLPVLLQLLTSDPPRRKSRMESKALCAPGKLGKQVFRQVDILRNWFHEPNPCISSYLESTKSLHGGISSSWLAENLL